MLSDNVDHNFGRGQVVPSALAPYVVRGKVTGQEDVINVGMTLGYGLDDLKTRIKCDNTNPCYNFGTRKYWS